MSDVMSTETWWKDIKETEQGAPERTIFFNTNFKMADTYRESLRTNRVRVIL